MNDLDPSGKSSRKGTSNGGLGTLKLLVVIKTDEDGWEVVSCPELPGCHSQGRTREEAMANIREAIKGYRASMREDGIPVPDSRAYEVVEVTA